MGCEPLVTIVTRTFPSLKVGTGEVYLSLSRYIDMAC